MFSNKDNVNILTALLIQHNITDIVVCPGSRNSALVHNFCEAEDMVCYPVTDERSAAFFAVGVSLAKHKPVVVCVTSGSALLDVAPAVAEAYYQNVPLIVISADRPAQWIEQGDGQTMPQANVLSPFVRKSVNLPEPKDEEEHWFCNRLVNEALIECSRMEYGPVHINVPISEPLFNYDVEKLPLERKITCSQQINDSNAARKIVENIGKCDRPLIVIGQEAQNRMEAVKHEINALRKRFVIVQDKLSDATEAEPQAIDALLASTDNIEALRPDLIIYMGGTIVSKLLKRFLRKCSVKHSVLIDPRGEIRDTFMNLTDVVQCSTIDFIKLLATETKAIKSSNYYNLWQKEGQRVGNIAKNYVPTYSQMLATKLFHEKLNQYKVERQVVYGNSSAVRLGNFYSSDYIFVNRGVNGIDGSLSTAVGLAAANPTVKTFCIIGDLSFFYDQNALWNNNLHKNLAILLLNNSGGGIFLQLPGLEKSAHRATIMGSGLPVTAQGACQTHGIHYLSATNSKELKTGLEQFFNQKDSPILLEIFTDTATDAAAWQTFNEEIKKNNK
ncbi:2-succinyl-5-enolpyruvyl-6-hydroxy-3-cyclohexene-1-carboxylic-acid synthase [Prevotella disiens]|uniref:2-succinyl-5-enolpyruvyl-6-hydroxy-3- cyclohexene-1-carboxylic-acid synthase n=1 Tax=Prevotella disiens TaxID=28130 RepID=UPI00242DEDB1|nr:2-succinyl-5-enolpyruvyl-6-hydroxy-3-cyclohexene-1-carboxylic-acid synthase [Prevotella disiens]